MTRILGLVKLGLSRWNAFMCRILVHAVGYILGVISVVLFYSVVRRYVFNNPVSWSEDVTNFLMVWMVLLCAPAGLRTGAHVSIDALVKHVSPTARRIIRILGIVTVGYVSTMIVWHGTLFSIQGMRRIVPSLEWLPFGFAYLALPVGYGLMILVLVEQLLETVLVPTSDREETP